MTIERNELKRLRAAGMSGADIARRLGVSRQRVHQYAQAFGVSMSREVRGRRNIEAVRFAGGENPVAIAKDLGVSLTTVHRDLKMLREAGINLPARHRRKRH